jgi:hypothetical protein
MLRIINSFFVIGLILVSIFLGVNTYAAQFESGESLKITNPADNLNVVASQVDITSETKRDLVVAGGTLTLKGRVERSLMAAGGNITIISPEIGATARIAGGSVSISESKFNEDLFIAAGNISLDNVIIEGDLVVGAGKISIRNSIIKGNLYGGYETLEGDLSKQVLGQVLATQEQKEVKADPTIWSNISPAWEINVLTFLILLIFILYRSDKLKTEINFNGDLAWDFLIGLIVLVLPAIALILSAFVYIFPITAIIVLVLYFCTVLAVIYTPIYLANLVKNTFKVNLELHWLIIIGYISLVLLNLLRFYIPILGFISFVFWLTNLGYLAKKIYKHILKVLHFK